MRVAYLKDYKAWIPKIAQWCYDEWHEIYKPFTLQDIVSGIAMRTNTNTLPLALVAIKGNRVIGTVSLKKGDLPTRPQYAPWLATLYVHKCHRNKNVGIMLVKAVMKKAKKIGIRRLYVYTFNSHHKEFYERLGWRLLERARYKKRRIIILVKNL